MGGDKSDDIKVWGRRDDETQSSNEGDDGITVSGGGGGKCSVAETYTNWI